MELLILTIQTITAMPLGAWAAIIVCAFTILLAQEFGL
jgi:hypothetical protein